MVLSLLTGMGNWKGVSKHPPLSFLSANSLGILYLLSNGMAVKTVDDCSMDNNKGYPV